MALLRGIIRGDRNVLCSYFYVPVSTRSMMIYGTPAAVPKALGVCAGISMPQTMVSADRFGTKIARLQAEISLSPQRLAAGNANRVETNNLKQVIELIDLNVFNLLIIFSVVSRRIR
jgi:hypothetical protein